MFPFNEKLHYCLNCVCVCVWRRQWQPTLVLLPGKSHGQRSLVGCSPWGCKESNKTERLHFHFLLSGTGEGNGNPLQYSCLGNSADRWAWRATVCGVARVKCVLETKPSPPQSAWTWLLLIMLVMIMFSTNPPKFHTHTHTHCCC